MKAKYKKYMALRNPNLWCAQCVDAARLTSRFRNLCRWLGVNRL